MKTNSSYRHDNKDAEEYVTYGDDSDGSGIGDGWGYIGGGYNEGTGRGWGKGNASGNVEYFCSCKGSACGAGSEYGASEC